MIALILLALLQIGDWYTTRTILNNGGQELNPIIQKLINYLGLDTALITKGILVLTIAIITGPIVTWIGIALYSMVVTWNYIQMRNQNV